MHSPTLLLLLIAFVGISSGTVYFRRGPLNKEQSSVQVQANLILHAFKNKNVPLLYDLIPFGYDIDRYIKSHPDQIISVDVQDARLNGGGRIEGLVMIQEKSTTYQAILTLTPSRISPTGYIMSKGFICQNGCELGQI